MLFASLLHLGGLIAVSIWIVPTIIFRTLLPALVPFLAFSAVQAATIPFRYVRRFCVATLLAVACVFAVSWFKFDADRLMRNGRRVSAVLSGTVAQGDALILYPGNVKEVLGYYFDMSKHPVLSVGLCPNPAMWRRF